MKKVEVAAPAAFDELLRQHYGPDTDLSAAVAGALAANPGLAAHGPVVPAGTEVVLPDTVDAAAQQEKVSLWT